MYLLILPSHPWTYSQNRSLQSELMFCFLGSRNELLFVSCISWHSRLPTLYYPQIKHTLLLPPKNNSSKKCYLLFARYLKLTTPVQASFVVCQTTTCFFPETRADLLKPLVLTCLVAKSTPNQTENVKIQIKEQFDTQLRPVDTSLQPRCTSPLREETRRTRRRWRGVVAAARHSARGVRVTQIWHWRDNMRQPLLFFFYVV